jgi:hypothetical protein
MVYNTQNYWFFGFIPSSGILGTRKHDVSETGSVPVLSCVYQLLLSISKIQHHPSLFYDPLHRHIGLILIFLEDPEDGFKCCERFQALREMGLGLSPITTTLTNKIAFYITILCTRPKNKTTLHSLCACCLQPSTSLVY